MRWFLLLLLISVMVCGGCKKAPDAESKESVKKAIDAYLAQRQNLALGNMSMEVVDVKFEGDTATAEVKFTSKQSSNLAVTVHYKLQRRDNEWHVESTVPARGAGGNPHGVTPSPGSPAAGGEPPLEPSH